MDSFDLGRLTDFDFEILCKDIMEDVIGGRFEIFSKGADGGIDLRRLSDSEGKIVVQCKHWHNTPRSSLINHLKNKEVFKVRKLKPERYILMTSAHLTPESKKKISDALHPYIKSESDVFGADEIVTYLNGNPEIVRRHLRLWLSSTSVLRGVVSQEIYVRSRDLVESLDTTALTYVFNPSFDRAMDTLEENSSCIISGSPGIGKTTLAQIVALQFHNNGYELIEISRDIDEVNKVWDDSSPQFFYYDDFLGQTTIQEKLGKNEDNRILAIMSRVQRARNKKLVFTTREYILRDAIEKYERLSRYGVDVFKCVVNLEDYSKLIRAEVLYNHVYFSPISAEQKRIFGKKEVYERIINREDFNPRLVAFTLGSSDISSDMQPEKVASFVVDNLKNPKNLWSHIVDNQLDSEDVLLLESLFLSGASGGLDEVKENHALYLGAMGHRFRERNFRRSLKILEGTMISISTSRNYGEIKYINPSIRDFVSEKIQEENDVFSGLCRSAKNFSAFRNIIQVASSIVKNEGALGAFRVNCLVENSKRVMSETVNAGDSDDIVYSLRHYLSVSEIVYSEDMASMVIPIIEAGDFIEGAIDGDNLVALVNKVDSVGWESINSCASSLSERVSEWISDDVTDWERAVYADSCLSDLGELASGASVSNVQSILKEMAEEGVGAALEGDYVAELDEMIDYIEDVSDHGFSAEDLAAARSLTYDGPDDDFDRSTVRTNDHQDQVLDSVKIELMFDSLEGYEDK